MALIKTIEELRQHISIDVNSNIAVWNPYIKLGEESFIKPILGDDFYAVLSDVYNTLPIDPEYVEVLTNVQRALAYYTKYQSIPELSGNMSDRGLRDYNDQQSNAAPRWKEEKLEMNALRKGDELADALLKYLEETASATVFPEWYASDANPKLSGAIVYGTDILSNHVSIGDSRRIYLSVRKYIREVEKKIIPQYISHAQYEFVLDQLKSGTPDEATTNLLPYCEPLISKMALYNAIPFLRVSIENGGLFIYSKTDNLRYPQQYATDAQVQELRKALREPDFGYESDIQTLKAFMEANAADYPLYADSGLVTGTPVNTVALPVDNSITNKHFSA